MLGLHNSMPSASVILCWKRTANLWDTTVFNVDVQMSMLRIWHNFDIIKRNVYVYGMRILA